MTISSLVHRARALSTLPNKSAVVLLSGGLDSATTLAIARSEGLSAQTLCFDYNQRHRHEISAAAKISKQLGALSHRVARVDTGIFSQSALTDTNIAVPKHRSTNDMQASIPETYVPARNILFLSYALALAESIQASYIYIGANAVDYSGYPDCRPQFFECFQRVADVGTRAGVQSHAAPQIRAPLLHWTKRQIIQRGLQLGVDYSMTHSCYDPGPDGRPCTGCDSCILRAEAFTELGFRMDPALERFETSRAALNPNKFTGSPSCTT
ncbi:7-cyano-7-deazaguanine synthase [Gracilariopsis chorda]|uniref:7-cyano-7-deazaguanine synthase n=1 Tax=Gracilariopsis chorda TaxID=448386 RepID=A0A2V3J2H2_9FLOR|nr:7-cyano-7-deazaguanine synthase [Gracilariopsis chorda]|eukprot:PXF48575.1 7-cyano-7-deazaguanine synthase [Gracilariopsis chorda]